MTLDTLHSSLQSLPINHLLTGELARAGRLAWALTAKQACQSSAEETMVAAHGAVQALHDHAVGGQALTVIGVAEEHLAVQKPAAVPAAQPCAAAQHGAAGVPAVHAEPARAAPAVHAGPGVQAAYDAESPAAAVLAGSRETPAALAFAAG